MMGVIEILALMGIRGGGRRRGGFGRRKRRVFWCKVGGEGVGGRGKGGEWTRRVIKVGGVRVGL